MKWTMFGWPAAGVLLSRTGVFVASLALWLGSVAWPTTATAAAPADCAKVELVTFRGSGEDAADDGDKSNGLSGPTLQRIINAARDITTSSGYTLKDAKVYGVPYPAIAVKEFLSKELDLFDSIEYGRLLGAGYIRKRHTECATVGTRFILAGYSQGVLAARQVAADLPADWIAGVFGVGDPAQKSNAAGVKGTGTTGNGIYRWLIEKDGKASSDSFYSLSVPKYLYCHSKDPVCDLDGFAADWTSLDITPHLTYGSDGIERPALAKALVDMAAAAAGKPVPPSTGTPGPADLMFAIDTTGSMSPYLAAAVASAAHMADSLHATTSRARVGLVEYRDYGDSYVARTVTPLTTDFAAFTTGLNGLVAAGGGDTPEAVYTGIVTALGVDWDRSAARALIVLGDAPAHDPELETGLTAALVAQIAKGTVPMPDLPPTVGGAAPAARVTATPNAPGQQPTASAAQKAAVGDAAPTLGTAGVTIPPVSVYGLSADASLSDQLSSISTATGGKTLPISAPGDVTDSVIRTVEDAATAPVARLTVADTVIAGTRTVLSGQSSTAFGAGVTYGFDFDADGVIDETNTEGATTHSYPTASLVSARLVITDGRGRTSEVTEQIDVRARDSLRTALAGQPPTQTPTTPTPVATPSPTTPASSSNPQADHLASTGISSLPLTLTIGGVLVFLGLVLWLLGRSRRIRSQGEQRR